MLIAARTSSALAARPFDQVLDPASATWATDRGEAKIKQCGAVGRALGNQQPAPGVQGLGEEDPLMSAADRQLAPIGPA